MVRSSENPRHFRELAFPERDSFRGPGDCLNEGPRLHGKTGQGVSGVLVGKHWH
jgi:hypothetical protein